MADKPSLTELMNAAKKMQEGMRQAQEDLIKTIVEGNAGGKLVVIKMNGRHEIVEIIISDEAIKEGKDVLSDLIRAAHNDAVMKVEKSSQEKMANLSKTLGLPPEFDLGDKEG